MTSTTSHLRYNLDEIKALPILDVCDHLGIHTIRHGRTHWCKVRAERTPSVILHTDTNTFYDFGNQAKGSNIDLVCYATGKSFEEAVEELGSAFELQPETPEDIKRQFRVMRPIDYQRLNLHPDLATKNFTFPIESCSTDTLLKIERKYEMSMNDLRTEHPKVYERIIREKAIPYVDQLRNEYYYSIWARHDFLRSIGHQAYFFDSTATINYFKMDTKELERAEYALFKAGQGTNLNIPLPKKYNPLRVMSQFMQGRLQIRIGSERLETLQKQAEEAEEAKEHLASVHMAHDAFFSKAMDKVLDEVPYEAVIQQDQITVYCRQKDANAIMTAACGHDSPSRPFLDYQINIVKEQQGRGPQRNKKTKETIER